MTKKQLALWFQVITVILIGFGALYYFWGLKIFSQVITIIPASVLPNWENALYSAILLGWGVTLLLLGRIAFKRDDKELKRALIIGLAVWLAFEALGSIWLGVWFDAGVDLAVAVLFGVPLLMNAKR